MSRQKLSQARGPVRLVYSAPPGGAQKPAVGVPFPSAEAAWFWYMAARKAVADGARVMTGVADIPRPCEPVDMYNVINRLYQGRLLTINHFRVLKFYGERFMRPDMNRRLERGAARLWDEAMARLTPMLARRGIIEAKFLSVPGRSAQTGGHHED
jgi:hypothetical protein